MARCMDSYAVRWMSGPTRVPVLHRVADREPVVRRDQAVGELVDDAAVRDDAAHAWCTAGPAVPAAENTTPRVVRSRSAVGLTTAALLPPSSRRERPNRSATRGPTARPIRVEPVALSRATPGWSTRACPTSAPPMSTWLRSVGAPQSAIAWARIAWLARAVSGASSDGFQTTGSPQTRAMRGVPGPDRGREVERADHADDAERVPGLHQPVPGALGGHRPAVELPGETHGEVADVDHLLDLAPRLGGDLADLEADQGRHVVLVHGEQLAEALDQGAAHRGRHRAPLQEGGPRPRDRVVDGRAVDPAEVDEPLTVHRRGVHHVAADRVHVHAATPSGVEGELVQARAAGDLVHRAGHR